MANEHEQEAPQQVQPHIHESYADGIQNIHFCGNQVRFDFMTLQPGTNDGKGNLKKQVNLRVIMNPQGFLTWYEAAKQLISKLEEAGIISKE